MDPAAMLSSLTARVYPRGPASPALVRLAFAAGELSRFRADPRFPRPAFERLYQTWIERSARSEIAAAVLVMTPTADPADLYGMVTVGIENQTGRIGLIAVDERARGHGIGGTLMRQAHYLMALRSSTNSLVTTQLDNVAACRLYRSAGYQLDTLQYVYHFWPQHR
jgi:dTDP-4-amino-4,6-dideoxy-D-galactose acyltransferase